MTNKHHAVLYTDVTNNIDARITTHKQKHVEGFTKKYNVTKLVYVEEHPTAESAILREKQIKAGSRKKKEKLIESINPHWEELGWF
jgi:putative endonuclease